MLLVLWIRRVGNPRGFAYMADCTFYVLWLIAYMTGGLVAVAAPEILFRCYLRSINYTREIHILTITLIKKICKYIKFTITFLCVFIF